VQPNTTYPWIVRYTDKIAYDAATTSGGSGEPLFSRDGKVIERSRDWNV
jgi:S1-C subfamily serine protease